MNPYETPQDALEREPWGKKKIENVFAFFTLLFLFLHSCAFMLIVITYQMINTHVNGGVPPSTPPSMFAD